MQGDFLIHIFCLVDDFCKEFEPAWKSCLLACSTPKGDTRNKRSTKLSMGEIMTIVIYFHHSRFRIFKDYYTLLVKDRLLRYTQVNSRSGNWSSKRPKFISDSTPEALA
jgi:hypothetical protein